MDVGEYPLSEVRNITRNPTCLCLVFSGAGWLEPLLSLIAGLSELLLCQEAQQLSGPSVLCLGCLFTPVVAEILKPWFWAGAAETFLPRGLFQLLSLRGG